MMKKPVPKKAMPPKKATPPKKGPAKPTMSMMKKGGMDKYMDGGALRKPVVGGSMGIDHKDTIMKKISSQPKMYGPPVGKDYKDTVGKDYKDTIKKPTMRKGGKATMRKGGKSC
jgi:hypothetical protein